MIFTLYKTKGLVIRSVDYRDADKILTVLTSDRGKINVNARGARRKNSQFLAASQMFSYCSMTIFEQNGRNSLNEAYVEAQFPGISKDLMAFALAGYIADILYTEPEDMSMNPEILRLALNSIYCISEQMHPLEKIKSGYELRYMKLCGYTPSIERCKKCNKQSLSGGYVSVQTGEFICPTCFDDYQKEQSGIRAPLDPAALKAALYILNASPQKIFSFNLQENSQKLLNHFCEVFLVSRMEKDFKSLAFYKSMKNMGKNT